MKHGRPTPMFSVSYFLPSPPSGVPLFPTGCVSPLPGSLGGSTLLSPPIDSGFSHSARIGFVPNDVFAACGSAMAKEFGVHALQA